MNSKEFSTPSDACHFMINYRQMPAQFCVHCLESYDMRFLRQLEGNVYHSFPFPCLRYISFLPGCFSFLCLGYFIPLPRVFFIPAWVFSVDPALLLQCCCMF